MSVLSDPHVLAKGCRFHGTNGIAFGPDGRLYAASAHIVALDPETGTERSVVRTVLGFTELGRGPGRAAAHRNWAGDRLDPRTGRAR